MPIVLRNQDGTIGEVHGLAALRDPVYIAWKSIRRRCCDRGSHDYPWYGARGIAMHAPWIEDPVCFVNWVYANLGSRPSRAHSIDRINNDGNYEPGNLRWATRGEQQNNKRSNRLITYRGETRTLQGWAAVTGIGRGTIRWRLVTGKPLDVVFGSADLRRAA